MFEPFFLNPKNDLKECLALIFKKYVEPLESENTALQAEVEAFKAEIDYLKKGNDIRLATIVEVKTHRDELQAEVERLKSDFREFLSLTEKEVEDVKEWKEAAIRGVERIKAQRDAAESLNAELVETLKRLRTILKNCVKLSPVIEMSVQDIDTILTNAEGKDKQL